MYYFPFARQCSVILSQPIRRLTSSQTATALRPFYFIVHPDLFGKYPKEKAVNENSLKHLNEYLEKQIHNQPVQPIILTFYIRQTHQTSPAHLHSIHVRLLHRSLHESVKVILRSCQLPLNYIDAIQPMGSQQPIRRPKSPSRRPIRWDPSFSAMYGMRDPDSPEAKPVDTLSSWVEKNLSVARVRQDQMEPIRQEVGRLRDELLALSGLRDVVWDSTWSQTQHRVALKSLLRLCTLHKVNLHGQTVNLCGATGICCHGNIMLKTSDVVENWLVMLQSVSRYTQLLHKLPAIELYLSTLLNSAHIVRRSTHLPLIQVYLNQLRRLSVAVRDHHTTYPGSLTQDLTDRDVVVECITGPLLVAPSGILHISSSTPAFLVIDFLNKNVDSAHQKVLTYQSVIDSRDKLIGQCYGKLQLRSLTHTENITSEQVMTCCRQLLNDAESLPVSLGGSSIQIANYFSVTSEGEMCIPWNYGNTTDRNR